MPASEVFAPGLLDGKAALVTGGGTGLGRAAAAELVACGARVLIAGRRAEVVRDAAAEIGSSWASGDVRSAEGAATLVDTALDRFGRLDVLVNNAGGQYFAPAEAIEAKGWRAVLRLNVGGILAMSQAAFDRAFRAAGRGTIVNVTLSPHHGLTGMVHSSAARAAAEGLTRELAARWGGPTACRSSQPPPATSRPTRCRSTPTPFARAPPAPSHSSASAARRSTR